MQTEIIYLSHSNINSLILYRQRHTDSAPVAIPLTEMDTITRMTLTLGTTLIDSDNGGADPIQWGSKPGYVAGEFRLNLGGQTITPGDYKNAWLVAYTTTYPNGQVWGSFPAYVMADVEAADPAPPPAP